MANLVGVDDRAHRLDAPVGDVEAGDADKPPTERIEASAGLSVDRHELRPGADAIAGLRAAEQCLGATLAAMAGCTRRGDPTAAVAVGHAVGGERFEQAFGVAVSASGGRGVPRFARCLKARTVR